jgi:tetratricopeptide (TPR) repeat protein
MEGGFHELNVQVKTWLRRWMLESVQTIATEIDADDNVAIVPKGEVADMYSNVAEMMANYSKYDGAISCHQKALSIRRDAHGPHHLDVVDSLRLLADTHRKQAEGEMATKFLDEATAVLAETKGDHGAIARELCKSRQSLAMFMGKYSEGLVLARAELATALATEGPNTREVAAAQVAVALALKKLGFMREARDELIAVVQIFETLSSVVQTHEVSLKDDPQELVAYNSLALIHSTMGEYDDAMLYVDSAWLICLKTFYLSRLRIPFL